MATLNNFKTLNEQELATVEGGGCSVHEADKETFSGMVGGMIGGIPGGPGGIALGGVLGGVGARIGYYASCWW